MGNRVPGAHKERARLWKRTAKLEGFARMISRCPMVNCPYEGIEDDNDEDDETQELKRQ